jgi:hypothetical protein
MVQHSRANFRPMVASLRDALFVRREPHPRGVPAGGERHADFVVCSRTIPTRPRWSSHVKHTTRTNVRNGKQLRDSGDHRA